MTIYAPHSFKLVGASSVILGSITSMAAPQGNDISSEPTAGSPFPRWTGLRSKRPMFSLTTRNVQAMLSLVGSTSLAIKSGGTYTALELYYAKLDDCGRIASGSVHRKIAFDLGCLVPRVLSCSAGQDAELSLEFMGLSSDGVTSPMSIAGSQALPTLPSDERFTIGPMTLESIDITRLQQVSLDFGNTITSHQLDTAIYPTHVSVDSQVARLSFTGMGVDDFDDNIPEGGLEITHANTEVWFRQRKSGTDALEADTASKHLLLTVDGLGVIDEAFSATANSPGTISGSVVCEYDGTNAPVTITADQNIEEPA